LLFGTPDSEWQISVARANHFGMAQITQDDNEAFNDEVSLNPVKMARGGARYRQFIELRGTLGRM